MFTSHFVVFLLLLFSTGGRVDSSLNHIPMDLVVLVHAQWYEEMVDNVKDVLRQLPDVFAMDSTTNSPEKIRLALVAEIDHSRWSVFSRLSPDRRVFENAVENIHARTATKAQSMSGALEMIRSERLFEDGKESINKKFRAVLIVNGRMPVKEATIRAMERLNDETDAFYYVISELYGEKKEDDLELLRAAADHLINFDEWHGLADRFGVQHAFEIKERIERRLCEKVTSCFFADASRGTCKPDRWTPRLPDAVGDCSDIAQLPLPSINNDQCPTTSECEAVCDEYWSTSDRSCSDHCGQTVARTGQAAWKVLEFCPGEYRCPGCNSTKPPKPRSTKPPWSKPTKPPKPKSTRSPRPKSSSVSNKKKQTDGGLETWQLALIVCMSVGGAAVLGIIVLLGIRWCGKERAKRRHSKKPGGGGGGDKTDRGGRDRTADMSVSAMSDMSRTLDTSSTAASSMAASATGGRRGGKMSRFSKSAILKKKAKKKNWNPKDDVSDMSSADSSRLSLAVNKTRKPKKTEKNRR